MKLSRQFCVLLVALFIFTLGLCQGFNLAMNKPLWNDEIFTQISSVEVISWGDIWKGEIGEGNNSPLFYSIQKIICNLFHYQSNDLWHKEDMEARFILRIAPVVCISLGLALLVWFFCTYYSWIGGLIAFIVAVSSYMLWYYWAEARPYALVFLGTTIQALFLLYYYRFDRKPNCWGIGIANLFLSLISTLSIIQIAASTVVLWFKGERRVRTLLACVGLPALVSIIYYLRADHYSFYFASYGQPFNLIFSNIPSGRLAAFFIIPILIWVWDWRINKNREFILWPFFIWGWVTLAGYVAFLGYLFLVQTPAQGFEVSNRYLMSLTPLGIIIFTVGALELIKRSKTWWVRIIVWAALLALILPRLKKVLNWMDGV